VIPVLRQRLIFGSALTVALIGLLLLDGYLATLDPPHWTWRLPGGHELHPGAWLLNGTITALLVLAFTLLAARELVRFFRAAGYRASGVAAQFFAAGFVIGPYIAFNLERDAGGHDESWVVIWLALAVCVAFLLQAVRRGTQRAMVNLATTVFIIVYTGVLAGFLTRLRMEIGGSSGAVLLMFSVLVVKMTDIGAFLAGNLLGRHKLIEWLSPKKTWEGLAGGVLLAVICAVALGSYLHLSGIAPLSGGTLAYPWLLLIFGLLMAAFSVAGDLCASLLKRDAAVKDSGHAIPGMGGILDLLDSPLLAAPAAWLFWTRLAPLAPGTLNP
jgi:phosphatidate cytidylyltransferase